MTLTATMTCIGGNNCFPHMSLDGAGLAITTAARDTRALISGRINAGELTQVSAVFLMTGLTTGSQTFTATYRSTTADSATFSNRSIIVIPMP